MSLSEVDKEGTIAGFSIPFLGNVLDAFDPAAPVPPPFVHFQVPHDPPVEDCGCHARSGATRIARTAAGPAADERSRLEAALRVDAQVVVPHFVVKLAIHSLFVDLGDIVVGRNATLVLESDLLFARAHTFIAYHGARIVQRSNYFVFDVGDLMRGGLQVTIHSVADGILALNRRLLAQQPATKP